jgi:Rrf2 family protein
MLRLTRKVDYAVLTLVYLARHRERACSAREVAAHFDLPRPVVANLLKMLARSGLLCGTRGNRGGYRLVAPPEAISLSQLLEIVEGRFALSNCAIRSAKGDKRGACPRSGKCPAEPKMAEVHARIDEILRDVSVTDLAGDLRRLDGGAADSGVRTGRGSGNGKQGTNVQEESYPAR